MTAFVDELVLKLEKSKGGTVAMNVDPQLLGGAANVTATFLELDRLCAAGALKARYGRHGFRNRIERVTVVDADALYRVLGRDPSSKAAQTAVAPLRHGAEEWEADVLDEIERCWTTHARWSRYGIVDAESLVPVQKIARALHAGLNAGHDMRTFSSRFGDDSKLIEKSGPAILAYLYHGRERPEGSLRDILARSGTEKITMPIMLSGAFSIRDIPVGSATAYSCVPVHETDAIAFERPPLYVLTVENLVSFHRHCVDINSSRDGLILFTSGQASLAWKAFYGRMVEKFADTVPFFHWGDIDGGGLDITNTIMAINPTVRGHLMSVDLARDHGQKSAAPKADTGRFQDTWMEPIARHLADPGNKTLEQETIDPVLPRLEMADRVAWA